MKFQSIIALLMLVIFSCGRQDMPEGSSIEGSITGTKVNLRDMPGISGKVLCRVSRPEKVTVLEKIETGDKDNPLWYKVTTSAGNTGYISSRYIKTETFPRPVLKLPLDAGNWRVKTENSMLIVRDANGLEVCRDTYHGKAGQTVKSIHGDYLFIALMDSESTRALLVLVFDTSMRKRIIKLSGLDNPGVLSVSPSKRYMLIDSGTAGGHRNFTVIDLKEEKEAGRHTYFTHKDPLWISGNAFEYHMTAGRKAPGKPELRQSADGTPNSYAQKIIWDDGKLVRTNEYTAVYSESDG